MYSTLYTVVEREKVADCDVKIAVVLHPHCERAASVDVADVVLP